MYKAMIYSHECCAPLVLPSLAPLFPHRVPSFYRYQSVHSAQSSCTTTAPRDKAFDNKGRQERHGVVLGRDQTALPRALALPPHPATATPPPLGLMVSLRCVRKAGKISVQGRQEARAGEVARRGKGTATPWAALPERGEIGRQILGMGLTKRWRGHDSALQWEASVPVELQSVDDPHLSVLGTSSDHSWGDN